MTLEAYITYLRQGNFNRPTYAFGIELLQGCPWALDSMTMPSHLVSQFHAEWVCEHKRCTNLPTSSLYLNSGYFSTNLHNDAWHTSFYTSMCSGKKVWRLINNRDFLKHKKEFSEYIDSPGIARPVKGKPYLVLGDLHGSFETWSSDSPLEQMNVTVYEGTLEPGQVLYAPAGTLHAARALDNVTTMVSTNENSFQDMNLLDKICSSKVPFTHHSIQLACLRNMDPSKCDGDGKMKRWRANKQKYGSSVERKDTPFLELYGCSKAAFCQFMRNAYGFEVRGETRGLEGYREYCANRAEL